MIILPILTASPIHLSLKDWENVLLEIGSGRVLLVLFSVMQRSYEGWTLLLVTTVSQSFSSTIFAFTRFRPSAGFAHELAIGTSAMSVFLRCSILTDKM